MAGAISAVVQIAYCISFAALIFTGDLAGERIVSTGHVTPPGEWLDQDTDEWVLVLRGRARLRIEGEADAADLHPGHHVILRAPPPSRR